MISSSSAKPNPVMQGSRTRRSRTEGTCSTASEDSVEGLRRRREDGEDVGVKVLVRGELLLTCEGVGPQEVDAGAIQLREELCAEHAVQFGNEVVDALGDHLELLARKQP